MRPTPRYVVSSTMADHRYPASLAMVCLWCFLQVVSLGTVPSRCITLSGCARQLPMPTIPYGQRSLLFVNDLRIRALL